MEIVDAYDEISFDPTPRLKSSTIPIKFISFNWKDDNCVYCGEEYIKALFCDFQKYCKKCLSQYINDITDNIYLDAYFYTMDLKCKEHEINKTKVPQNIQECRGNCVRILCFKQINVYNNRFGYYRSNKNDHTLYNKVIKSEKNCKLCGKSLYQGTDERTMRRFKLCSDCYIISYEWIASTLVKEQILILYLPWWFNGERCNICGSQLTFASDCQKYCVSCFMFYVGCKYCLTTNIIFGPTDQSKCKKCKRISFISEYIGFDDFILNNISIHDNLYNLEVNKFEDIVKSINNIDKFFEPYKILSSIFSSIEYKKGKSRKGSIGWIPFPQFTDVKEIAKGGYGIIYKATWSSRNKTVILKRFENSKNNGKYFLNEVKYFKHFLYNFFQINLIFNLYNQTSKFK
jgi:hypothetical protein